MAEADIREKSRAVWDAMAPGWDDRHAYIEAATRPVTEAMIDRASLSRGATVLDLAAGTGLVGLAAAARVGAPGRVIVGDFAAAMVEVARRNAERLGLDNVECRILDAEKLDLESAAVDVVLCRWGYMLMPDPARALAETHRVLRDGGRLACAVFGDPDQNPWAAVPMGVLRERELVPPARPGAPGILSLAERSRLHDLLTAAGFTEIHIEDVAFTWPFADDEDYWQFLTGAAGAIAVVLDQLPSDVRDGVRAEIHRRIDRFDTGDGIRIPATALVASATAA